MGIAKVTIFLNCKEYVKTMKQEKGIFGVVQEN
jgi:hypothetical protein